MCYKIKSKIWIEVEGKVLLGEGRVCLLNTIKENGSLSKADRQMQMSYKKASQMISTMNQSGEETIVTMHTGGKDGGGTQLTLYGNALIKVFEEIHKNCWNYLDKQLNKINI